MTAGIEMGIGTDSDLAWEAKVAGGEITAIAVRGGDSGCVVVATEEGSVWWVEAEGTVAASTSTAVDVPIRVAVHPSRDQIAVAGARGYAVWSLPGEVRSDGGTAWSNAVAYNAHGDLAVATGKQVLILPDSGEEAYVSEDAPSTITDVVWSSRDNHVLASAYGGVYVHNGRLPAPVHTFPYAGSHLQVAPNPNGKWVCSGNQDSTVHIWRTADNDELTMSGYPEKVTRLAFDRTGQWLANNGAPDLTVWDFAGKGPRGRQPRQLEGHERVVDLDWNPARNNILASVGSEGTARVWDITGMAAGRSRTAKQKLPFDDARALRWLDGNLLVVVRGGGVLSLVRSR
ncbi:WD40 repeat domain-containing protein [Nocardioides sp. NPDC057772]|uniref:WD40 repeat domain-containing protein n=1 Tax=Nocardioides sp. NPDC057772 TaxID=3346245 RepID=UPI00366AC9F7